METAALALDVPAARVVAVCAVAERVAAAGVAATRVVAARVAVRVVKALQNPAVSFRYWRGLGRGSRIWRRSIRPETSGGIFCYFEKR